MELLKDKAERLKAALSSSTYGAENKQEILYSFWQFCEKELRKPVIQDDGLSLIEKRIKGK